MSPYLAHHTNSLLGESPIWNPIDNSIYFVDIKKRVINRFCILTEELESIPAPSEIGCIVLNAGGGLVAAMHSGLAFVDFHNSEYSFLTSIDNDELNNRPNDGKCDELGRLWVASMDNKEIRPSGRLWKISSSKSRKIMDSNFIVGNGIDWSPDSKKMYFTDSTNRIIYVYDFDLIDGSIKNRKVFAAIPESAGYPDGLAVDSYGYIWSAHWDGWQITRYCPNGNIDMTVSMPVPRPTSLAFGGENLSTLYITSASFGLSPDQLRISPLSGGLFAYDSPVSGRLSYPYLER